MSFWGWGLRLGGRRGGGVAAEDAAPVIGSVTISPASAEVGETFTAAVVWTGWPRSGDTYEWRDGASAIPGATASTYYAPYPIASLTVSVNIDNGVPPSDSAISAAAMVTATPLDALLLTEDGDALLLDELGDELLLEEINPFSTEHSAEFGGLNA